jgi:hypothetical protein
LLLLFILAAGNAYWSALNSLLPSLVLAPAIWAFGTADRGVGPFLSRKALWPSVLLTSFACLAFLSLAINDRTDDSSLQWVGTYLSPALIVLAVQTVSIDETFCRRCWIAIAAGALVPLSHGLIKYYGEWGIPTGADLLLSRYSLEKMEPYMHATYGNTGNTAAYLALILPAWIGLALARKRLSARERIFFGTAALIGIANVLIVESRTLFIVLALAVPCVLLYLRIRATWAVVAIVIVGGVVALPLLSAWDQFLDLTVGAFEGTESDSSVSERVEAMRFGLRTLADHPAFGLGPGNTLVTNPYTSAHQYWVQQGSELGVWGLALAAAISLWVLLRVALLVAKGDMEFKGFARFIFLIGPGAYVFYGCIANMPLSQNVVNSWIGLFAAMVGLSGGNWLAKSPSVDGDVA